jgi:hypothetical protein
MVDTTLAAPLSALAKDNLAPLHIATYEPFSSDFTHIGRPKRSSHEASNSLHFSPRVASSLSQAHGPCLETKIETKSQLLHALQIGIFRAADNCEAPDATCRELSTVIPPDKHDDDGMHEPLLLSYQLQSLVFISSFRNAVPFQSL